MKQCTYCGKQYPDEVEVCAADAQPLKRVGEERAPQTESVYTHPVQVISPEEQRFWSRMNLRQLALLVLRLQAVLLIVEAAIHATYLPLYFNRAFQYARYSSGSESMKFELFMAILRVLINAGAALALIQYSDRVLSWFVKDWIVSQPPEQPRAPIPASAAVPRFAQPSPSAQPPAGEGGAKPGSFSP